MTATQYSGRHRRSRGRELLGRPLATAAMMTAAGAAGWILTTNAIDPLPAAVPTQPVAAPSPLQHEEIQRTGQVIAATQNSVTTSTPDGQTTTFRITSETARIGQLGLKANVVVMGVVHDGVPVATAIADHSAVGQHGQPMDYELPA